MMGYCGDKAATAATIDKDGWLHTGDVGYYDEDGFFYIVDRIKELIKYKGFQVAPAELETILLTHPDIKDAAVVGLSDEIAGELPFAFIVKQPNAKITTSDVVKYINGEIYFEI
jgi:4-coumarate--CoA ligase